MGLGIDLVLDPIEGGVFDLRIGFDGDLETRDFFDTAIVVSLFGDRRANESEVAESSRRRGWIGNEQTPGFEMGSKLWLFEQARLTRTTLNQIEDAARASLQWLVDDGLAVAITGVRATATSAGGVALDLTIERSPAVVERRYFELWQNTGV